MSQSRDALMAVMTTRSIEIIILICNTDSLWPKFDLYSILKVNTFGLARTNFKLAIIQIDVSGLTLPCID